MSAEIVLVENVSFGYDSSLSLENVSFKANEGDFLGIVGPNGAGKTSLIRIITQITLPDEGRVIFDGQDLSIRHSRETGYLPEEMNSDN